MAQNNPTSANTDTDASRKHGDTRTSRTIRFSDPEWEIVEEAVSRRGGSPAEFVRNAALTMAADPSNTDPGTLPPEIVELIKHTYRGVYLLATLKRDEMVADGRRDEIDSALEGARKSQSELTSGN